MTDSYIVTATPDLQECALAELGKVASGLRKTRDLKDGIFLVETDTSALNFTADLIRADPIFVKHIMPVQTELGLTGRRCNDLPALCAAALGVADLAPGERFSVQCRRTGHNYDYSAKDVEVFVGSHFETEGAIPAFSDMAVAAPDAQKVISGYLFGDTGYIGFSTVRENLNEHSDEHRIFSRHPRHISRAQFKLLEALRKFKLDIPRGRALDLGAAPGGWTQVLVDAGMDVVAVDPAELDEEVMGSPRVTHIKAKAEDYVGGGDFALLVNDMGANLRRSAEIMAGVASHLQPGAYAIMTVKLDIKNPAKLLANIRPILEPAYEILKLKHLYHNRSELTVLLRKNAAYAEASFPCKASHTFTSTTLPPPPHP